MQLDEGTAAMLSKPFCCECRHYSPGDDEGMCCRGVRWGTHSLSSVSAQTMREDGWWGVQACGRDGRFWEAAQ